jgi:hypothetical protein
MCKTNVNKRVLEITFIITFIITLFLSGILIPVFLHNAMIFWGPTVLTLLGQFIGFLSLHTNPYVLEYKKLSVNKCKTINNIDEKENSNSLELKDESIPEFLAKNEKMYLGVQWIDYRGEYSSPVHIELHGNTHRWLSTKFKYKYYKINQYMALLSCLFMIIGNIGMLIALQYSDALMWLFIITFLIIIKHICLLTIQYDNLCINHNEVANCKKIIDNCIPGCIVNLENY